MKRIIYIVCCALLAASCKKEKLTTYNAADNIYFNYLQGNDPGVYIDSIVVTFAFSPISRQDSVFLLPVAVTGSVKDHDRAFEISTDRGTTAVAGSDYTLPSTLLIRAGQTLDTIPIHFKRTSAIKNTPVTLNLRLKENDQFRTQIKYRAGSRYDIIYVGAGDTIQLQTFRITLSDQLAAGPYWDNYSYYFGDFSEKKVRLINQIIGMPLDFWSVDLYGDDYTKRSADAAYYGGFTFRYLSDQAYQGNIIYEEDGVTPMAMGSYFQ